MLALTPPRNLLVTIPSKQSLSLHSVPGSAVVDGAEPGAPGGQPHRDLGQRVCLPLPRVLPHGGGGGGGRRNPGLRRRAAQMEGETASETRGKRHVPVRRRR